jgi:hypothetical protein
MYIPPHHHHHHHHHPHHPPPPPHHHHKRLSVLQDGHFVFVPFVSFSSLSSTHSLTSLLQSHTPHSLSLTLFTIFARYALQQTAYQNIMATCSMDGRCVLVNDEAEPIACHVRATILNTMTGVETEVFNLSMSVAAGAGASKRWCAIGAAPLRGGCVAQPLTVPTNRYGYNAVLTNAALSECKVECLHRQANATSSNDTCVGFTMLGSDCWLYPVVEGLSNDPAATWYVCPLTTGAIRTHSCVIGWSVNGAKHGCKFPRSVFTRFNHSAHLFIVAIGEKQPLVVFMVFTLCIIYCSSSASGTTHVGTHAAARTLSSTTTWHQPPTTSTMFSPTRA